MINQWHSGLFFHRNQGNVSSFLYQPLFFFLTISLIFFPIFRRRRTKLQAHLKESRSLKNYAVNAHNALEAKMRASDVNMPMQEVKFAFLYFQCSSSEQYIQRANILHDQEYFWCL